MKTRAIHSGLGNLAAIIDHYIARLDGEQRALLSAATVCGVDFRAETVALALGRELAAVATACDDLVRQHVWLSAPRAVDGSEALEPRYSFKHALFRCATSRQPGARSWSWTASI